MGGCLTSGKSKDKLKTKICSQIQEESSVNLGEEATDSLFSSEKQLKSTPSSSLSENSKRSAANMSITNPIKKLVSKKRIRHKEDGFNLDLTYITSNIIAMGFPASSLEGCYRNHIDDVAKFLDTKHKDHYFIYNLCSERTYDKAKFHHRVSVHPFDDHNPPKIESIEPFCKKVHDWLAEDEHNVAAVHCKAGKGRTGTMICCYLLHSNKFETAEKALGHYGQTRTQDKKGVTIPSQVRYVKYYENILRNKLTYTAVSMCISEFIFTPAPNLTGGMCSILYCISQRISSRDEGMQKCKKQTCGGHEVKKGVSPILIKLEYCPLLTGDVKIEFYNKTKLRKEKLFHFWFNTFFVNTVGSNGFLDQNGGSGEPVYELCFEKNELDGVNKRDKQNKQFSADFKLTVRLRKNNKDSECASPPNSRDGDGNDVTPSMTSESSEDSSQEEDDWDSGFSI